MAELLALSRDTSSAPYLKTLIIVHDGTATPLNLMRTFAKALENFSMVSKNLATLGVRRSTRQTHPEAHETEADIHLSTFTRQLLAIAKRADLLVSTLVFELEVPANIFHWSLQRRAWTQPSPAQDEFVIEVKIVSIIMESFDTTSFPGIGRGFRFVVTGQEGTRKSPSVIYDPVKQSLNAVHLEVDDWKVVLRWLPRSTQLKVVNLYDCNIEFRAFDNLIINSSLKSLSVEDVTLVWNRDMTGHWRFTNPSTLNVLRQDWKVVFEGLYVRSPELSSCRLGQLGFHYSTHTGATWEANGIENIKGLLCDLKWKKRSRLAYKKANAPDSGRRKPFKKVPRARKFRFTRKKASKKED